MTDLFKLLGVEPTPIGMSMENEISIEDGIITIKELIAKRKAFEGHKGRPGKRGGSLPKGAIGSPKIVKPLSRARNTMTQMPICSSFSDLLTVVGEDPNLETVRSWAKTSFDEQYALLMDNETEYERIRAVVSEYYAKEPEESQLDSITVDQYKALRVVMAHKPLSAKELSRPPSKDNTRDWFWQNFGVVMNGDYSDSVLKLYATAFSEIAKKHKFIGGFFMTGVDASWREGMHAFGNWDSAYLTIHFPKRLGGNVDAEWIRTSIIHEYGHFIDSDVVGSNIITVNKARTREGKTARYLSSDRSEWASTKSADKLGFSREEKPGYVRYPFKDFPWYRDPKYATSYGFYKDATPHELFAEMYERWVHGTLSNKSFHKDEMDWWYNEIVPKFNAEMQTSRKRLIKDH